MIFARWGAQSYSWRPQAWVLNSGDWENKKAGVELEVVLICYFLYMCTRVGLEFNIQKTVIMASDPITSWQINVGKIETVADFIFLGSKITADSGCSHEIKRCLYLGRKVMTNLGSILKSRDVLLPTKVRLVKAVVFPVVMYRCESWTRKWAEHQRMDAFELWCWKRLLKVPWTERRSHQSILKEISPEYSL